jgi:hypothetical protein
MALNASGTLSIGGSTAGQSINLELGRTATTSSNLNESALRTLAGVASGQISISSFYGKSNDITSNYALYHDGALLMWKNEFSTNAYKQTTSLVVVSGEDTAGARGTSTSTVGYFFGGTTDPYANSVASVRTFTFSGNTSAQSGVSLTNASNRSCTAGNATKAISTGGYNSTNSIGSATNIYTYGTSCTTGTASAGVHEMGYACGNATYGHFCYYGNIHTDDRWTYSSNTKAAGVALTQTYSQWGGACSTTTNGYFSDGGTTAIVSFSANTKTNGTAITYGLCYGIYAGNPTVGLWGGGDSGGRSKYTYSNNTVASFTISFSVGGTYGCGVSNPPGGF